MATASILSVEKRLFGRLSNRPFCDIYKANSKKKSVGARFAWGGGDPRLGSRSEGRCRRLTHQQTPKTRTTFFNDRLAGPKNPDSYSGRTPGRQVVSGTPTTAVLIGGWQSPRSYLHDYLSLPGGTLSIRTGAGQGAMAFSSSALGRMDCSPARMSAFSLACATRGWALGGGPGLTKWWGWI